MEKLTANSRQIGERCIGWGRTTPRCQYARANPGGVEDKTKRVDTTGNESQL